MKIQLQSLRVINCGPLRDVCIHFATDGDSPTTVLAGANGSGKTTVLKLIVAFAEMLAPSSALPPLRLDQFGLGDAQLDWLVDGQPFFTFYGQKPENTKLAENYYGRRGMFGETTEKSGAEAVVAVSEKEDLIEPLLSSLETAYRRINGKHLLFQIHQTFIGSGINRDQFRSLLARAVKERVGLPEDIKLIIEQRALA